MSTGNTIELCRQIHELRTDATIMEAAMRAYENMIEERDDQISDLKTELHMALQDGEP